MTFICLWMIAYRTADAVPLRILLSQQMHKDDLSAIYLFLLSMAP